MHCRARNAAVSEWRQSGGGPGPGAGAGVGAVRDYLTKASLNAYDREEEHERDKDQAGPHPLPCCPKMAFITNDPCSSRRCSPAQHAASSPDTQQQGTETRGWAGQLRSHFL